MSAAALDTSDQLEWSRQIEVHRKYLVHLARTLLSDVASAEDIVQETLMAALHGAQQFEQRSSLRTWLTVILKRKVLDFLRAAQRAPVPLSRVRAGTQGHDSSKLFDEQGTWCNGPLVWDQPEQALMQSEFMEVFERCLQRLPVPLAKAFVLRTVMDAETHEVTSSLGVTANHLAVTLYRARMALRECLSKHWFASPAHRE